MFVRRLVSWVTGWGGPLGTASGQQLGLPLAPIIDQTKLTPPDAALQISAVSRAWRFSRRQYRRFRFMSIEIKAMGAFRTR